MDFLWLRIAHELHYSEQQNAAYRDNFFILSVNPASLCIYAKLLLLLTEEVATLRRALVGSKTCGFLWRKLEFGLQNDFYKNLTIGYSLSTRYKPLLGNSNSMKKDSTSSQNFFIISNKISGSAMKTLPDSCLNVSSSWDLHRNQLWYNLQLAIMGACRCCATQIK